MDQAEISDFGSDATGQRVLRITLDNGALRVSLLTRGAVVQDVRLSDVPYALTLGSTALAAYEGPMGFFGAVVGPVANRIGGASARIGDQDWALDANEAGRTTLHGGSSGSWAANWGLTESTACHAHLALDLPHGFGGFPGFRRLRAEYRLDGASLTLRLTADTDRLTAMNLANHSYWNLDGTADTSGHRLRVAADAYLPVDADLLPTGGPAPVAGTSFDLRDGARLERVRRFDHCFCLGQASHEPALAAELTGASGVSMTVETTEPGLQVYDGAGLATAPHSGHGGKPYGAFAGIALEAQRWPDAIGRPGFPAVLLAPDETYEQITRLTFRRA